MARLPQVGGDNDNWGSILNDYLLESLNSDGTLKPVPQDKVEGLEAALDAEETARQAGDTDSRNRANHTGTQTASTISNFAAATTTAGTGTFAELAGADFTGTVNLPDGSPAVSEDVFNAQGPSGRELAYAESSIVQTGITTATDITNLTVSFTVGSRPVLVEALVPFLYCNAVPTTASLLITDGANATRSAGSFGAAVANNGFQLIVRERISTPGSYTRKARLLRFAGSGSISVNFDSTTISSISVTER